MAALIGGLAFLGAGAQAQVEEKAMSSEQRGIVAGDELYKNLCSACHGFDGRGVGPAATALSTPVADLTLLAQRNGGKFPTARVRRSIQGKGRTKAHGTLTMPVWGPTMIRMTGGPALAPTRLQNLVDHIESLQR